MPTRSPSSAAPPQSFSASSRNQPAGDFASRASPQAGVGARAAPRSATTDVGNFRVRRLAALPHAERHSSFSTPTPWGTAISDSDSRRPRAVPDVLAARLADSSRASHWRAAGAEIPPPHLSLILGGAEDAWPDCLLGCWILTLGRVDVRRRLLPGLLTLPPIVVDSPPRLGRGRHLLLLLQMRPNKRVAERGRAISS